MTYAGGKGGSGVYQKIISMMPKHSVYIETHLGGGSIMRRKKKAAANIGIDIDEQSLNEFRYYIDENDDPRSNIKSLSRNVKNGDGSLTLLNINCIDFLKKYDFKGGELVYCDPPYLFETRKSQKPLYRYEYTQEDHIKLLNVLLSLPCFVIISGYKSSLYMEMLEKWQHVSFTAQTRRGPATETVWMNFEQDKYLKHDYSYIGDDFRERERIQRKAKRWLNNLNKMPSVERNYILSQMVDSFSSEVLHHQK